MAKAEGLKLDRVENRGRSADGSSGGVRGGGQERRPALGQAPSAHLVGQVELRPASAGGHPAYPTHVLHPGASVSHPMTLDALAVYLQPVPLGDADIPVWVPAPVTQA